MADAADRLPVVVVGSLNLDLVTTVRRHPRPGETVLGTGLAILPGGKGANQAVAAARAGARVSLVGRVGDDDEGARYLTRLSRRGVDVRHVSPTPGEPTGRALICVSERGENTIVVIPGANAHVRPGDLDVAPLGQPSVVLLQFELPMDVVGRAARMAAGHGGRVVLNASPVADVDDDLLALADPLIVNEHEAAQLLGSGEGTEGLARGLRARGARSVVVTLGAHGAVLDDGRSSQRWAAPRVEVIDTTGAGDVFAGTVAAQLARAVALPTAVTAAIQAASLATMWRGAQNDDTESYRSEPPP